MNNNIQLKDAFYCENGKSYFFVYDGGYEEEPPCPYYQVEVDTYKIVDAYPSELFERTTYDDELVIGGKILEVF